MSARHRPGGQHGFSLIELMIVLLIIAILLAVAIPTYLSARNRAENRAAQMTVQNVLVAAKAAYASQGDFNTFPGGATTLSAYLNADGPGAKVNPPNGAAAARVAATNEVSASSGAQHVVLAAWAPDGKCWYLLDIESASSAEIGYAAVPGPGTYFGAGSPTRGAYHGTVPGTWGCTVAITRPTSGWQTSFTAASAKA
jgi:prepilin-type N-terminal cleavage/methylation domain-containing protein